MGFSVKQTRLLRQNLRQDNVRRRIVDGREFSFVEGWTAIAEANRIFGFDGWDRETTDLKCVATRGGNGTPFLAIYTAKVRITVRNEAGAVVREGHGSSEGRGATAYEAHSMGLKGAETDATKRALATFGRPFGLSLYSDEPKKLSGPDPAATTPVISHRTAAAPAHSKAKQPMTRWFGPGDQTIPTTEVSEADARADKDPPPADTAAGAPTLAVDRPRAGGIDKSTLAFATPKRHRDKLHLRYVAMRNCVVCGLKPADAHHLKFAQPRAVGLKVSDEFTVPLCRGHHRELHNRGNEIAWWHDMGIDPLPIARSLWSASHQDATGDEAGEGDRPSSQSTMA